jgi:hypothetical protein
MAKLGELILKGASGTSYTFDVYPSDVTWKDGIACVYYVSKRTPKADGTGGTHAVIYVGETEDLKNRHVDHHKQECFDQHGCNAISILQEGDAKRRLQIEADLVKGLNPPCNG